MCTYARTEEFGAFLAGELTVARTLNHLHDLKVFTVQITKACKICIYHKYISSD